MVSWCEVECEIACVDEVWMSVSVLRYVYASKVSVQMCVDGGVIKRMHTLMYICGCTCMHDVMSCIVLCCVVSVHDLL